MVAVKMTRARLPRAIHYAISGVRRRGRPLLARGLGAGMVLLITGSRNSASTRSRWPSRRCSSRSSLRFLPRVTTWCRYTSWRTVSEGGAVAPFPSPSRSTMAMPTTCMLHCRAWRHGACRRPSSSRRAMSIPAARSGGMSSSNSSAARRSWRHDALELGPPGARRRWPMTTEDERMTALLELQYMLRRSTAPEIEALLDRIRRWHGAEPVPRDSHAVMTSMELSRLTRSELADVGAHSRRHGNLANASPDDQWDEIAGSRRDLLQWLGTAPTIFSYPFGRMRTDFSPTTMRIARAAGYRWHRSIRRCPHATDVDDAPATPVCAGRRRRRVRALARSPIPPA